MNVSKEEFVKKLKELQAEKRKKQERVYIEYVSERSLRASRRRRNHR